MDLLQFFMTLTLWLFLKSRQKPLYAFLKKRTKNYDIKRPAKRLLVRFMASPIKAFFAGFFLKKPIGDWPAVLPWLPAYHLLSKWGSPRVFSHLKYLGHDQSEVDAGEYHELQLTLVRMPHYS